MSAEKRHPRDRHGSAESRIRRLRRRTDSLDDRGVRRCARWLTLTGALYAAGSVDFVARPRAATRTLNVSGGAPLEDESPGLYHALASAYMATIAALALSAGRDPVERRALIPPLLVAKATSSAAMLYRYARTRRRGFAIGAAIDAALLGVTAGVYGALER